MKKYRESRGFQAQGAGTGGRRLFLHRPGAGQSGRRPGGRRQRHFRHGGQHADGHQLARALSSTGKPSRSSSAKPPVSTSFRPPARCSTGWSPATPSQLFGTLSSNGRVVPHQPEPASSIGTGAVIDTAGFVGSTLNLSNADFLAGAAELQLKPPAPARSKTTAASAPRPAARSTSSALRSRTTASSIPRRAKSCSRPARPRN